MKPVVKEKNKLLTKKKNISNNNKDNLKFYKCIEYRNLNKYKYFII